MKRWLTGNVIAIGLVSLLTDAASEMIIPLLPIFVTGSLQSGALALGAIEGTAEAVAATIKLLSGRLADRVGKNKPFVLAGYTLSSIARPFIAAAAAPWHVVLVRALDRVGKGLRSSPRDAILSASVAPEHRAKAFGFHRAMDHAGAVIGPLAAVGILLFYTEDLRFVFWMAAIPGALAVIAIVLVRDPSEPKPADTSDEKIDRGRLARFLVPLGLFTLGNASDVFLLLKAYDEDAPLISLPLLWAGLHVVKTLVSTPGGWLADRYGHRRVIVAGWTFYAAIYAGFAFVSSPVGVVVLFVIYGVYHGLCEGAEKALVAEAAGARKRGTTFGIYHMTQGLLALVASLLFGLLWDVFSPEVAFLTGAGLALAAVIALIALTPRASR